MVDSANQHFLFPDYFKIRTMGRHMFERVLNYAVSNRLGRFSFSYAVMKRFVMLFYDVICPTSEVSLEWLLKRLRRPPSEMMDWTLVEFFLFYGTLVEAFNWSGVDDVYS